MPKGIGASARSRNDSYGADEAVYHAPDSGHRDTQLASCPEADTRVSA